MWPLLRHGASPLWRACESVVGTDTERQSRPWSVARAVAARLGRGANGSRNDARDHGRAAPVLVYAVVDATGSDLATGSGRRSQNASPIASGPGVALRTLHRRSNPTPQA